MMKPFARFILLFAMAFWGVLAVAQNASMPVPTDDDKVLEQLMKDGVQLVKQGQPGAAINNHFDKIIATLNFRYKDEKRKMYTSRGPVDTLFYMLEAATSKDEPKKGAIVVTSLWSDAWYMKAYALTELKRPNEARSALESALELSPRHSQYLSELGNYYIGQRNWPEAFKAFEKAEAGAKEFSPPDIRNVELSRAWRGMGYVYIEQNRLDDAEKMYQKCLDLDKADQRAASQLGYIQGLRDRRAATVPNVPPSGAAAITPLARESTVEPASPQLLDYLYKQLAQVESPSQAPGAMPAAFTMNDARTQLRQLGPRAWPLAPRIAELLAKTEKYQYDFAWTLMEMVPPQPVDDASVNATIAQYQASNGSAKLVELARLGKTNAPSVNALLKVAAGESGVPMRLLAAIGFAYAGKTDIAAATDTLAALLSDKERSIRTAAANSLRLLGPRAENAAPALIAYLKTGENVYMASSALKVMPIGYLRQARPEFEKILANTRLTDFQKRDAVDIMMRLETEK